MRKRGMFYALFDVSLNKKNLSLAHSISFFKKSIFPTIFSQKSVSNSFPIFQTQRQKILPPFLMQLKSDEN